MKRIGRILTAPLRGAVAAGRYLAGVARALEDRELVLLVGLVLLSAGVGLIWAPLALVFPGAILTGVALDLHVPRGTVA